MNVRFNAIQPGSKKLLTLMTLNAITLLTPCAHASLVLDQNRVIFPESKAQVSVVKVENPTQADYLMQSWVEDKNGKPQEDIFVEPPLAKIKANHKVALRLTTINHQLAKQNEEQLYWLNVKEIPRLEDASGGPRLAIVMRTRIKVLYRPDAVGAKMEKAYTRLEWKKTVNGVTVHNPTPYYITFNKVWAGNDESRSIDVDMIAPHADLLIKSSAAARAGQIHFSIINDFGDTSETVTATVM